MPSWHAPQRARPGQTGTEWESCCVPMSHVLKFDSFCREKFASYFLNFSSFVLKRFAKQKDKDRNESQFKTQCFVWSMQWSLLVPSALYDVYFSSWFRWEILWKLKIFCRDFFTQPQQSDPEKRRSTQSFWSHLCFPVHFCVLVVLVTWAAMVSACLLSLSGISKAYWHPCLLSSSSPLLCKITDCIRFFTLFTPSI